MLLQALKKRKNGEDLTPEEIELLKEFDGEVAVFQTTIEALKIEKGNIETEHSTTNETVAELTANITKLSEQVDSLTAELTEKNEELETLNTSLASAENLAEVKVKQERLKQEQDKIKLTKQKEKEKQEAIDRINQERNETLETIKNLQKELNDIKTANAQVEAEKKFLEKMMSIKKERPYLETQIDVVMKSVEGGTTTIDMATSNIEFLVQTSNHEIEMEKYNASKQTGSVVDQVKKDLIKDKKTQIQGQKVDSDRVDLLNFAKEYGVL